jgi:hypothetical protein
MTRYFLIRRDLLIPCIVVAIAAIGLASCSDVATDAPARPTEEEAASLPEATQPDGEPTVVPTPATETPEPRPTPQPFWMRSWDTDFSTHDVPLSEIMSGGVPRDGIPPIDEPKFVTFADADAWLSGNEPVIAFEIAGDARAYPLQILTWHEIVNDEVGGVPVAVTFCPLCNAAIAFERDVDDLGVLRFGVSGLLRFSDLIMWDDKTQSFWQQMTGDAIVGELTGRQLTMLPAQIVAYDDFKQTHPDGIVLSRDTGHTRNYGVNPYVGYDDVSRSPFLFDGPLDDRRLPMERVLTLMIDDDAIAFPYDDLRMNPIVYETVGGEEVVVFWQSGTASALDQQDIASSRNVGAAGVFSPVLDGRRLTFVDDGGRILDRETGSEWNVLGLAVDGPLAGSRLDEYVNGTHFWFAWAAFQPDTRVWEP